MIPGSRKQKYLSDEEISRVAQVYHKFKHDGSVVNEQGFARVASVEEVRTQRYALAPGRYVGATDDGSEDEPLSEVLPELTREILAGIAAGNTLDTRIKATIEGLMDVR
jgi:type I restriction enzyme M protein